jgi:hypothetical protein
MRRTLLAGAAVALGLSAQSAWADVDVLATIDKDKDVLVFEYILKVKYAVIQVDVDVTPDKAAESLALVNQTNKDNEACENCAEKRDELINSVGGVAGNSGIVTLNQAAGNMNNQGNNLAVAVDFDRGVPGTPPPEEQPPQAGGYGFAEAQASTDQRNGSLDVFPNFSNTVDTINLFFRDALIENSINNNAGIVMVNQAPGNINNQANNIAFALSFAEVSGVALSEADLGQVTINNVVLESNDGFDPPIGINKSANVVGSMSNNVGIVAVNQAAGNLSNQSNTMAVAVVTF